MGLIETIARALPAPANDAPGAAARADALAAALAQGTPGLRDEDWRYTDLAAASGHAYTPAPVAELSGDLPLAGLSGPRFVFVNGRHSAEDLAAQRLPEGIKVRLLAEHGLSEPGWATECLARQSKPGTRAFVALNAAAAPDGLVIDIAPGTRLSEPLVVIFMTASADAPVLVSPHLQINAGAHSEVSVVEVHTSGGHAASLSNAYTRLVTGDGAKLRHYRVVTEGTDGNHIGTVEMEIGRDSEMENFSLALSGRLIRVDVEARMGAPGGNLHLNGVFLAGDAQHIDHHTRVVHDASHTSSEEVYKGIADGTGRGVFNGKIVVPAGVSKVVANQSSHNLLLSSEAEIDTKPELEINADDLRCAHGATVGQLDDESLFYLQSRGVPAEDARALLTFGFVQSLVETIPLAALQRLVAARFATGNPRLARLLTGDFS